MKPGELGARNLSLKGSLRIEHAHANSAEEVNLLVRRLVIVARLADEQESSAYIVV